MPSIISTFFVTAGFSLCVIGGMLFLGGEYIESHERALQSRIIHDSINFWPAMLNFTGSQYEYILNHADNSTLVHFRKILSSLSDNVRELQRSINVNTTTCNLYEPQEFAQDCRNFLLLMGGMEKSFEFAILETQKRLNEFEKSTKMKNISRLGPIYEEPDEYTDREYVDTKP